MLEVIVNDSSCNAPNVTNVTSTSNVVKIPVCKRVFTDIDELLEYISIGNDVVNCPNDIRFLNSTITLNLTVLFKGSYCFSGEFNIPAGFIFDGGSLPLGLQWTVRNNSRLGYCAHDYEYRYRKLWALAKHKIPLTDHNEVYMSQLLADELVIAIHKYRKVSPVRRCIAFYPLRAAGSIAFKNHRRCDDE